MNKRKAESSRKVLCDRKMEIMKSSVFFSLRKMMSDSEARDVAEGQCEEDLAPQFQSEVIFFRQLEVRRESRRQDTKRLTRRCLNMSCSSACNL